MLRFRKKEKESPHIEITSLIDIIFTLLIFVMLCSTFSRPAIKVKLPVAATKEKVKKDKIVILLTEDDRLFIDKKEVNLKNLQYFLEKKIDQNPDSVVLFHCDENVVYKKIVGVIDILKNSGVKNVAISHRPKK